MISKDSKIYIAGHKGMVGSAIWRCLEQNGYSNLYGKTSQELDLRNQNAVSVFLDELKPEAVIVAAAKVGGIMANKTYPYEFLMDNIIIQHNIIQSSFNLGINKLIFLGSSCIYPKYAPQPIHEDSLLTSSLEPTNEAYAIAKIAGVKACQAIQSQYGREYVSLMPTNLYGINDNFDLNNSHVLPAMIRKFDDAKTQDNADVVLWGSGQPLREFLYVDDLAEAVKYSLENSMPDYLYNVGFGSDLTIKDLAEIVQEIVGHTGKIIWDSSKPDGTPRKLMDSQKLNNLGWIPKVDLKEGIEKTYNWYKNR
ncbi:GDP-L-fucose synthase family protein [Rhizosphaericola mali]|uniref:GDP-L-fucose synthase n=1 Tax=Rhizosphaericola mali TaxID=2545455 RepID=A0A5P2G508_9BACT|nr:GDP-L-fucose synthase [Rhizosphaericola mali]QES89229.1 GDP-L-fucose synthase [Rhizosphaericola mali]